MNWLTPIPSLSHRADHPGRLPEQGPSCATVLADWHPGSDIAILPPTMAHAPSADGITNRAEEYLETILNMTVEGKEVFAARLVERLEVSAPTVSAALGRLRRDGLITIDGQRQITLSPSGRTAAVAIVRRHRLVERLLTDYLGVAWSDCHEEACLLEHAISPRVEAKLYERLGRPTTCPHGNPIPVGSTITMPECQELTLIPEGATVKIVRVTEEVSDNRPMMEFLQHHHFFPGERFQVDAVSPEAGTITLHSLRRNTDGNAEPATPISIALTVASALFVAPE